MNQIDAAPDPIDAADVDATPDVDAPPVENADAAPIDAEVPPVIDAAPVFDAEVPPTVDAAPVFDAAPIDATPPAPTHPTGLTPVDWNGQPWSSDTSATNAGFPAFSGAEVTLTPNMNDRGAVVFYERDVVPPFTVNFEYQITDTDGCATSACQYNSADGIAFFFFKDSSKYLTQDPPAGGGRGVINDGTGVTLNFEIYAGNKLSLRGPTGNLLNQVSTAVYTGDVWRPAKIIVTTNALMLFLDGSTTPTINYTSPTNWDTSFKWLGFGGGTGGAAAEQKIRNVNVIH